MSIQMQYEEDLQGYLTTKGGICIKSRLDKLINTDKISQDKATDVLEKKASEYYRFTNNPKNTWGDISIFLVDCPEIFDNIDVFLAKQPTIKFIMAVNSFCCSEIENIFSFKKVVYSREDRLINNKKTSFYIVLQPITKKIWYDEPFGDVFHIAEQSGFRVGLYFYSTGSSFGLANIRSFPINDDGEYSGDYSRGAGGLRADIGIGFKSSWEANFARILNLIGLKWKYESNSFHLDDGYYFPDFKVYINSDTYYWVEIKGFWDSQSLKKVWSFKDKYKDEQILILDSDLYFMLEKKYADRINNWEYSNKQYYAQTVPVIGITFGNRLRTIENLESEQTIKLSREQNNEYDPNAIKVLTMDNLEIGYLAKEWASIYAFKIDLGLEFSSTFKKKIIDKKRLEIQISLIDSVEEVLAPFKL